MGSIGWTELLIVFGIVVLLFGAKKIPQLARSMGIAKREFQKGKNGIDEIATGELTSEKISKEENA